MLDFTNIADNCFMVRMQGFSSECSDVECRAWYQCGTCRQLARRCLTACLDTPARRDAGQLAPCECCCCSQCRGVPAHPLQAFPPCMPLARGVCSRGGPRPSRPPAASQPCRNADPCTWLRSRWAPPCLPPFAARGPAAYGGDRTGLPVFPRQRPHRPHLPVNVQAGAGPAAPHLCSGQLPSGETCCPASPSPPESSALPARNLVAPPRLSRARCRRAIRQ